MASTQKDISLKDEVFKTESGKKAVSSGSGAISANRLELLHIADAVAREKMIDKQIVFEAMSEALKKAAQTHYGLGTDIHVAIDTQTGVTQTTKRLEIVEKVEDDERHITHAQALKINPEAKVGEFISEDLPPIDYGRVAAQAAKQVITGRVREAEREKQYEEYKDRIGEIINGIVRRVEYGNLVVDLGHREAMIRRDQLLPKEVFRSGDRVRAYITDVRRETRGSQIFLSRTAPQFMVKLFVQEVPEIYDGVIEILAVARDPGSRAKIAVVSNDTAVDPVGACVGMRGSRVQAVVNELQGEKVDIIPWSEDLANFVVNALVPAEVSKIVLDDDSKRIEVVVPDAQLSAAIGRRGQNVRLASQLTGRDIDVLSETDESERRQAEFVRRSEVFMTSLDVDDIIAQLLASEGFISVEDVALVGTDEIVAIEGISEETAQELQSRAREFIEQQNAVYDKRRLELGVTDELAALQGITPQMLTLVGEDGSKTLEDFAGYTPDDLVGWREKSKQGVVQHKGIFDACDISRKQAEELILTARVAVGWIREEDLHEDAPEAEKSETLEDAVFSQQEPQETNEPQETGDPEETGATNSDSPTA